MNWATRIFNPYSLLILGVFIKYFPAYYFFTKAEPSINVGSVSLYITDIIFIYFCVYAFFSLLRGQTRVSSGNRHKGRGIQIIFGLLIALSFIKWLLQSNHDIASLRMLVTFTSAYVFLFFFPLLVTQKADLRSLHYLLVTFLVYIFVLHIYAFSALGFTSHILSGGFLTMLSLLYFLTVIRPHALVLSPAASFCVKALVITTFLLVGHRSGFIGIFLGLAVLLFFNKRSAIKEVVALVVVVSLGAGTAMVLSPTLLPKLLERATTTFDASQETYQLRYDQLFVITQIAMEEHPIIGRPMNITAVERKRVARESKDSFRATQSELVLAPHNLLLEWLYYYGSIGLLLGLTLILLAVGFIRKFLAENKNDIQNYQIGVAVLCTMTHNLFFAVSNATAASIFATFFLYFPIFILVSISRNNKSFRNQAPSIQGSPR